MFQKGEIVKWFETYGDVLITKDCGIGIVVSKHKYPFAGDCFGYRVYRIKKNDYTFFEEYNLEKIKETK